jgi:hypothetical protein
MFIQKWGMSSGDFTKEFLNQGNPYEGKLKETEIDGMKKLKNWVKRKIIN